jgi:hypothetical protein
MYTERKCILECNKKIIKKLIMMHRRKWQNVVMILEIMERYQTLPSVQLERTG